MNGTLPVSSPRASLFQPMQPSHVPRIDLQYWGAISAASVFGCNLGDFTSLYLHLGHWIGLFPLAASFYGLTLLERRTKHGGEGWYWAAVIVLRRPRPTWLT